MAGTALSRGPARSAGARLLFLVTEDWYFCLHWIGLARAARDAGFEVVVATRIVAHGEQIRVEGFGLLPLRALRRGLPGPRDLGALIELVRLYRREAPAIVHHLAMKPILYGSWAARIAGVPAVVNSFAGLGYLFTGGGLAVRILRWLARLTLRRALALSSSSKTIFNNGDDFRQFEQLGIVGKERAVVIRGVGIDTSRFCPRPEPDGVPIVLLASRMLWDKGVAEFVGAARLLAKRGVEARCVLAGRGDPANPASIPDEQLEIWKREGVVEWWGHQTDMPGALASAHVVVLPSYREGLPTVLLEAAASGRAIVGTDVPGCREIVRDGVNGYLVPPRHEAALADAIETLLRDPEKCVRMGRQGRRIVVDEFSIDRVAQQTLAVYRALLDSHPEPLLAPSQRADVR